MSEEKSEKELQRMLDEIEREADKTWWEPNYGAGLKVFAICLPIFFFCGVLVTFLTRFRSMAGVIVGSLVLSGLFAAAAIFRPKR